MTKVSGRRGARRLLAAMAVLAVAPVHPPVAAVEEPPSAVLRVETDGFRYLDGSRDSVLHTTGWCPGWDERLLGLGCPEGGPGSAELHTGLLGFGALRRVSPAPPSEAPASRRLLVLDVFPDRAGTLQVTVDAASAGGATFALVSDTAVPVPQQASAEQVTWTAVTQGTGQVTFVVAYDTDFGDSTAVDAIPATTVRLDQGEGAVAAEHMRGAVSGPAGTPVQRISELVYAARLVGATGQPQLDGGHFAVSVGSGRTGVRLSNTHQVTALGHAPPLSFATDLVTAEYSENGRHLPGLSISAVIHATSDSMFGGVDYEPKHPEDPPWFRVFSGLGVDGQSGRGLIDGETVRGTYHVVVGRGSGFQPGDQKPRNDEGRLVLDWDGRIFDLVGFTDAYGHLPRRYGAKWASVPPYTSIGTDDADARDWLHSMWTVEARAEGGDIDRRNVTTSLADIAGNSISFPSEPDASMHLAVPEGWQVTRVVTLGGGGAPMQGLSNWNEDGSVSYERSVADGEYWLESEIGSDGLYTWSWPLTILTDAWRLDGNAVRPPAAPEAVQTHNVPAGEELVVEVHTIDGGHDRLVLGPGTHQVRVTPGGALELVTTTPGRGLLGG